MGRYTAGGVGRDLIAGALAGAAAVWVTDKLDWSLYRSGGAKRVAQTEAARPGGMDPAHALAKKAADAVGVDVGDPKDNPAGHTVHYALAMGMGALYGLLRGVSPAVTTGRGGLYGLAMFVLKDEVANTVMGTAGSPLDYPVQDHARGAAAHTLFGIVTDLGTRLLAPWRDEVVIEQGPPLSERIERGRHYLEQGRQYVQDQGLQYLEQGRQYLEQGRQYAGQVAGQARSRLADVDTADLARRGQRHAERFARDVRSRLPDVDASEIARAGQKHARRFAEEARSRLPDVPRSGLSRALDWLFG
ncbi:MAG: hypothetical protein JOZ05_14145 [Acetobacteraceae bacterium]|nr:hypothetical protein [Acetobacteraceae bacterium]